MKIEEKKFARKFKCVHFTDPDDEEGVEEEEFEDDDDEGSDEPGLKDGNNFTEYFFYDAYFHYFSL